MNWSPAITIYSTVKVSKWSLGVLVIKTYTICNLYYLCRNISRFCILVEVWDQMCTGYLPLGWSSKTYASLCVLPQITCLSNVIGQESELSQGFKPECFIKLQCVLQPQPWLLRWYMCIVYVIVLLSYCEFT